MKNIFQKHLVPVIKLAEPKTYRPWDCIDSPYIVIRLSDFLSVDGTKFNLKYYDVINCGGLHNFLSYHGRILLSSVIPDKKILGFTVEMYIECINNFRPDFYMTPDGETYEGQPKISQKEIDRIIKDTEKLVKNCPASTPFGLVKGSTFFQIENHVKIMLSFGITFFALHTAEFFRDNKIFRISKCVEYAKIIRKFVPYLAVYGIGSKENIRKFFFVDDFITQSHYTKAFRRKVLQHGKWVEYRGEITRDVIMNNLKGLELFLENLKKEYGGLINGWWLER